MSQRVVRLPSLSKQEVQLQVEPARLSDESESESLTHIDPLMCLLCCFPSFSTQTTKTTRQTQTGKGRGKKILLPFQMAMLIGMGITYTVVGGESLHAFANAITPAGNATLGTWVYIIMFGGLQFLLSMVSMHTGPACGMGHVWVSGLCVGCLHMCQNCIGFSSQPGMSSSVMAHRATAQLSKLCSMWRATKMRCLRLC